MSNYTKTVNFAAKDALTTGDPNKVIQGTEIDTEFANISTAVATKADKAAPTFTGLLTFAQLLGASGATVTAILDEDNLASNSDTALATQQSIKAYIDSTGSGDALVANPLSQFAATTSAQLAGVLSDETGSGAAVFATSPTLVTPLLGTPTSGTLTNCTGLPIAGTTGYGTGVATALAVNVGSAGAPVVLDGALGTPSSGTLTNATGLPAAGVVGTAAILGANTFTGLQTFKAGADIASATTVDLTAATGNTVVITGTTTTTALTMTAGQQMVLLPSGAWPLTYHATTMNINGGASYTCAAGDRIEAFKDLAGVIRVNVVKQDGTAVVSSGGSAATETSTGSNVTLTASSDQIQAIAMTAADLITYLPDATTLSAGDSFIIKNTGSYGFVVRKNGGTFLVNLLPGQIAIFYCTNIGAAAGTWAIGDESLAGPLGTLFKQSAITVDSVTGSGTAVASVSETQAVMVFPNASNYPQMCTLNLSGLVLTAGTVVQINTDSASWFSITKMSATQCIATWATGSLKACTINISGTDVTNGTVLTVATGTAHTSVAMMTSVQAICTWKGTSNYPEACTLDVSGTSLTNGAVTVVNAATMTYTSVCRITDTVAHMLYGDTSTYPTLAKLSISGTTITAAVNGALKAEAASWVSIVPIDSTKSLGLWIDALLTIRCRVMYNYSGGNYVQGPLVTLPVECNGYLSAFPISSSKVMLAYRGAGGGSLSSMVLTITPSFNVIAGQPFNFLDDGSTPTYPSVGVLSSGFAVGAYVGASSYKYATLLEITP